MQRMMLRSLMMMMAMVLLGAAACGPNPPGKLPVSSPVYSFQEPDTEDLLPAEDEDEAAVEDAADTADGE